MDNVDDLFEDRYLDRDDHLQAIGKEESYEDLVNQIETLKKDKEEAVRIAKEALDYFCTNCETISCSNTATKFKKKVACAGCIKIVEVIENLNGKPWDEISK